MFILKIGPSKGAPLIACYLDTIMPRLVHTSCKMRSPPLFYEIYKLFTALYACLQWGNAIQKSLSILKSGNSHIKIDVFNNSLVKGSNGMAAN